MHINKSKRIVGCKEIKECKLETDPTKFCLVLTLLWKSSRFQPSAHERPDTACPLHPSVNGRREACLTDGGTRLQWNLPHIMPSVWLMDPSQPEKLQFLNFWTQETEPTERTDPQCILGLPHAKSMRSVNGRMQWARGWSLYLKK